jgi:hypothetical protein
MEGQRSALPFSKMNRNDFLLVMTSQAKITGAVCKQQ